MFGMGGSEIIVILIVALLFLGPDKLPQAAKSISKGIRDIKKQSRALQQQIESDEQIGGAIRDLKSALRGDEAPHTPKPIKPRVKKALVEGVPEGTPAGAVGLAAVGADGTTSGRPEGTTAGVPETTAAVALEGIPEGAPDGIAEGTPGPVAATARGDTATPADHVNHTIAHPDQIAAAGRLTLPPHAGEPAAVDGVAGGDEDLAAMVKPARGTIAKGT